ncbi:MAG: hypothetical protein Kow0042_21220 [Calditrichia bacterium]
MNPALLSAIISFLSLDTTVAFQILISSPIFACPFLGLLLGDVRLGFELGFLFQLLWLGRIPAGATIIPEGNMATMIATALILLNKDSGYLNTTLTLVFIMGIGLSYLGAVITIFYRKMNGKILDLIIKEADKAHFRIIRLLEVGSMALYALLIFLLTYSVLLTANELLPPWIQKIGRLFEEQLIIIKPTILGIGLASIFPLIRQSIRKQKGLT